MLCSVRVEEAAFTGELATLGAAGARGDCGSDAGRRTQERGRTPIAALMRTRPGARILGRGGPQVGPGLEGIGPSRVVLRIRDAQAIVSD
jgi:hypothetical protein